MAKPLVWRCFLNMKKKNKYVPICVCFRFHLVYLLFIFCLFFEYYLFKAKQEKTFKEKFWEKNLEAKPVRVAEVCTTKFSQSLLLLKI